MRWGVRDEMTNEHMTTALCMNELRQVGYFLKNYDIFFILFILLKLSLNQWLFAGIVKSTARAPILFLKM
jgi:hypothetical protein